MGAVGPGDLVVQPTATVRQVADETGLKLGKLAQPLRAALTGRTTSPGIFDVLVLLGQGESLARIADQMKTELN